MVVAALAAGYARWQLSGGPAQPVGRGGTPFLEGCDNEGRLRTEPLCTMQPVRAGGGVGAGARRLYERALAIREEALGPDHPRTRIVADNLRTFDETAAQTAPESDAESPS